MIQISTIENETQLKLVLEICYNILGQHLRKIDGYKYEDWLEKIDKYSKLLLYAHDENKIIAAVLGRHESADSLVMGFTACEENYRMRGITRKLVQEFEMNAKKLNYKYITLGADKDAEVFYEKCGYIAINEVHGQCIYQKIL